MELVLVSAIIWIMMAITYLIIDYFKNWRKIYEKFNRK